MAKKAKRGKTVTKKAKGGGVMHKAYSYKNKKGTVVHVASHIEHPRRGKK